MFSTTLTFKFWLWFGQGVIGRVRATVSVTSRVGVWLTVRVTVRVRLEEIQTVRVM
jgi:hypothetical protein